jgi:hypothetical protein
METSEYIVYTLLVLVLIAFVGIVGYVIYDNYKYKDNLTSDLNTNFKDINRNFNSTSNVINQSYNTHTSNLNSLSENVRNSSNVLLAKINFNDSNSSNYVNNTSNISFKNIDTFNYNLNKYFTFKETDTKSYSDANNKLFEYRTDALGDKSRLELMTKTFANSGLQLNTITGKELGICNKDGDNCFNVVNTADSLYIYKAGAADKRNIYIGGAEGTGATAPFKIIDGKVHITGELHINGSKYDPAAFATSGHAHPLPPSDATATAILGGKIGSIELTNGGGSGYNPTIPPSVQFSGGGGTGASATAVIGTTGTELGKVISFNNIISGSGYTSAPSITIADPPAAVGTATAGVKATANAILVKPIASFSLGNEGGTGYTNAPNVNIIGGNGSGAEAIASVLGGKVTAVTLKPGNNGGSYTTAPTITFTRAS